jgi:hypothetical protein
MMLNGIKRLTIEDYSLLVKLVNSKSGVTSIVPSDPGIALRYRKLWLEGMSKWYLIPQNNTNFMYGFFKDGVLVSCMSWRCGLHEPWNDGWVVGNLKSLPGYSVKSNGILELWEKMFEICDGMGLTKWHMVIPESNSRRYQAVADRYFKDIDSRYDYEWSIIVPANTKPDIDWVWATMGRMFINNEVRVRTGTKKQLNNISKE